MDLTSALIFLGVLGILVLVYDLVLHTIFDRSLGAEAHARPFHYWRDRLVHRKK